jgi:hypothetical protein
VAEGAGFVHTANNSRFRVGANPTSKLEYGISKLVGSEGVFGTVPETGWVLATPNARAPSTLAEPLTRSPDVHNKTVLDYFVGAGLPADQIGLVNAHATVKGSGVGSVDMSNGEFAGYTSVLSRTVAGIPVPDSFAWARFNVKGESVEEQVYWPAIPGNVIQEAKRFQAIVSDPVQYAALLSKVPASLSSGRVVIRHSPGTEKSAFQAVASYDVLQPGEMGGVRHFDSTGAEFNLANEVEARTARPPSARPSSKP